MTPKHLLSLEIEFRRSVEMRQFEDATRLADRYCRAAAAQLGSIPAGSAEGRELVQHVCELLDWGHQMLVAARAAIADDIAAVPLVTRFFDPVNSPLQFRIEA